MRYLFTLAALVIFVLANLPPGAGGEGGDSLHALAFLFLGATGYLASGRWRVTWLALMIFGGAVELAQLWLGLQRDPSWTDWLIDIIAALVGIGIGRTAQAAFLVKS